jgi:hypothetical protein
MVSPADPHSRAPRPVRGRYRSLVVFFVLGAFVVGPGARGGAADEPAGLSRQQALERFRKMSPEARLERAVKAGGVKAFVSVTQGDLAVTVVERGTLDAAEASDIVCRVKARSAHSTIASTIKWVIEDGTAVKKGDRLVEVDAAGLRDHLAAQKIAVVKAKADTVSAKDQLEIWRKLNQLDIRRAGVDLKQAKRSLKKYSGEDEDEKEILQESVEIA